MDGLYLNDYLTTARLPPVAGGSSNEQNFLPEASGSAAGRGSDHQIMLF